MMVMLMHAAMSNPTAPALSAHRLTVIRKMLSIFAVRVGNVRNQTERYAATNPQVVRPITAQVAMQRNQEHENSFVAAKNVQMPTWESAARLMGLVYSSSALLVGYTNLTHIRLSATIKIAITPPRPSAVMLRAGVTHSRARIST
jgi:hypothetical protein